MGVTRTFFGGVAQSLGRKDNIFAYRSQKWELFTKDIRI